jgi:MoaA/NifB/PqqE/SkfB family radical SAM enzyme
MSMANDYRSLFDGQIAQVFRHALKACLKNPRQTLFFTRVGRWQKKAARVRADWQKQGVHVPPLMIASITSRCNLNCRGCYARTRLHSTRPEMARDEWQGLLTQARELGISIVMLAGGEPLARPEMLELTRQFPEMVFPLFTNGLLLDERVVSQVKDLPQVVPVLSIEGWETATDSRRGRGVYDTVRKAASRLSKAGVFFGVSLTVTRENFNMVTDAGFVESLLGAGCRLFVFVEYTPVEAGTEQLTLEPAQKAELVRLVYSFQEKKNGVFVVFPGDEEQFGGCLAAGRGFIHVSPDGSLEPCPFAPYSDTNVRTTPLKDALGSRLLQAIRDNHGRLSETKGGCALWAERDWVRSLVQPAGRKPATG